MSIQAVILAGGLGTRLRSVDSTVPKPLIKICGKPFLYYQMMMLRRRGISRMLFLLSYKNQLIVDFLAAFQNEMDVAISYCVEKTPLGTGGALRHGLEKLEEQFLVLNGDSYLDMDYAGFSDHFISSGLDAVMTVYDNAEDTDVIRNAGVTSGGLIYAYSKSDPLLNLGYVDAGVLAMRRDVVVDLIPSGKVCSMEIEVYPRLIARKTFGAYVIAQRFYDIGTPERLKEFTQVMGK
ncbi:hypothetical protein C4588_01930 [Candidatus Parcubacteria bacterium]|nr:MAG: hypothetical protein C4588_01930 [Candidatus Parcubacteria bacterium]